METSKENQGPCHVPPAGLEKDNTSDHQSSGLDIELGG
jgi:hypothetical protein